MRGAPRDGGTAGPGTRGWLPAPCLLLLLVLPDKRPRGDAPAAPGRPRGQQESVTWPHSATRPSAAFPGPALLQARFISAWETSLRAWLSPGVREDPARRPRPAGSGCQWLLQAAPLSKRFSATPCSNVEQTEGNAHSSARRNKTFGTRTP